MTAPYFRIKSWAKYQHYKKRNPPWIKLHRELLQSRIWVVADDASRVLALASMMLAAATNNKISTDPLYLQRVAYLSGPPDLLRLADLDFIEFINENNEVIPAASMTLADASKTADVASLSLTRDRDREEKQLKSKPPLQQERSTTTVTTGIDANANGSRLGAA